MSIRTSGALALATLLLLSPAIAAADSPACPEGSALWNEYRLYFGRNDQHDDEVVSEFEWQAFLAASVTPRFPDGLSVLEIAGQWRDSQGLIRRERSKLLQIYAPPGGESLQKLHRITDEYKQEFEQQLVLGTVSSSCVWFR